MAPVLWSQKTDRQSGLPPLKHVLCQPRRLTVQAQLTFPAAPAILTPGI